MTDFIVYDDGCHLRKYALNSTRKSATETAKRIASTEIVIDKMHFRGHVDKWCQDNCNPSTFKELEDVSV